MQKLKDAALWLAIFLCGGLLACMLAYPALAQEAGTGIICDTPQQTEQYVSLAAAKVSNSEAIQQINGTTHACGIISVAYLRGAEVSRVRNSAGTFVVVGILVIAADIGMGLQPVTPLMQYTVFRIPEDGA